MVLNVLVAGYANKAAKRDIVAKLAAALEAIDSGRYTVDSTVYAPEEEAKLVRTRHGNLILAVDDEAGVAERKQHMYHVRALLVAEATTDDVAQFAAKTIVSGGVTRYVSTRGAATEAPVTFLDAVRLGLAHDGGLYVPKESPSPLPQTTLNYLVSPAGPASYIGLAQIVLEHLVDRNQVPPGVLSTMISTAYDAAAWGGSADCCPVTDVTSAAARAAGIHVALSEQFHGPTSAFKDFALQLFPQFFDLATTMDDSESSGANYLILTATSGDTGGAAINGFVRGAPHIKVMVLYPTKGVSPVQRVQMLSMHGGNVHVLAVDGDFDLCQSAVKTIFGNTELKKKLRDTCGTELSSANSINWGRLLPQIVYYVWSYASLVRQGKLVSGEPMDVCIPTGNFGNILACFYAKSIGVPIGRLILASNCNDVLADFVNTGVYDISARSLSLTASPSIDILRASNVERFLFLCTGGDAVTVAALMASLNSEKKRFEAPEAVKAVLRSTFWALQCNEADCRKAIRDTLTESGKLIDPHTAVAVHVATQYLHATAVQGKAKCILVASTAHWAKFPEPVAEAIGALPSGGLKGNAASVADIKELYRSIVAAAATTSVSLPLADILSRPGLLEHGPRVGGTVDEVVSQLLTFAAATATAATSSA